MSDYTPAGAGPGTAPKSFAAGHLGPMIEVAARTGNACGRAYLAWQDELLRFTSTRLRRDAEFGSNLLKCDKWEDAARLQQSWVASTVDDYVSEANKLFELAASLTTDVARRAGAPGAEELRRGAAEVGAPLRDAAEGMAHEASRHALAAGERGAAMAEATRRQASGLAEEARKAADAAASRERGNKRR